MILKFPYSDKENVFGDDCQMFGDSFYTFGGRF